jgi:hypothetical protein
MAEHPAHARTVVSSAARVTEIVVTAEAPAERASAASGVVVATDHAKEMVMMFRQMVPKNSRCLCMVVLSRMYLK